ncbi:MAG: hypothetical protein U0Y82_05725 [Thermoleophilia bacterium]
MECLLIVDFQVDFCPGGALAVADGDAIAPTVAALAEVADLVVATRDWHPPDHGSFTGAQVDPRRWHEPTRRASGRCTACRTPPAPSCTPACPASWWT